MDRWQSLSKTRQAVVSSGVLHLSPVQGSSGAKIKDNHFDPDVEGISLEHGFQDPSEADWENAFFQADRFATACKNYDLRVVLLKQISRAHRTGIAFCRGSDFMRAGSHYALQP